VLLGRGLSGERVADRYVLDEFLGEGGFGVVYSAREVVGDDYIGQVAVKICPPPDENAKRQLVREVQAMAQLAHPSLVGYRLCGVVPQGALEGSFFIVMELCDRSLRVELVERGALPPADVSTCFGSVAEGVAHMHEVGAVHRDIKPENILRAAGRWKLGDMGLARAAGSSMTTASRQIGTLVYMSPEIIDGQIGAASDVYALGVSAVECLTGHLPFSDTATTKIMRQILTTGPDIPTGLPAPWDSLAPWMLSLSPKDRPSARQVYDALRGMPYVSAEPAAEQRPAAPTGAVPSAVAPVDLQFAAACDMALADGVLAAEEKEYLKTLSERLGLQADAANHLFAEAVDRRAKRPLTDTGEQKLALGNAQRQEACRAIAELYKISELRVRNALEHVKWDVDLAIARLEAETEQDRRAFALMEVARRSVVPDARAKAALEQVGWDAEAAVTFISAADERTREAARQAAAQRAAERKEHVAQVARVAGGVVAGAAAVGLIVAVGGLALGRD